MRREERKTPMELDEKIKAKRTELKTRIDEIDRIYKTVKKNTVEECRLDAEHFELSCTVYRLLDIPVHVTKEHIEEAINTIDAYRLQTTKERDLYVSQGNGKAIAWFDVSIKVVEDSLTFLKAL